MITNLRYQKLSKYTIATPLKIWYHWHIQVDYAYSTKNRHFSTIFKEDKSAWRAVRQCGDLS